jgi:hypothetical protein
MTGDSAAVRLARERAVGPLRVVKAFDGFGGAPVVCFTAGRSNGK